LRSGNQIEKAFEVIRARIPALVADRPPAPDIRVLEEMIDEGDFASD
jgi:histidine ammonia-lyase